MSSCTEPTNSSARTAISSVSTGRNQGCPSSSKQAKSASPKQPQPARSASRALLYLARHVLIQSVNSGEIDAQVAQPLVPETWRTKRVSLHGLAQVLAHCTHHCDDHGADALGAVAFGSRMKPNPTPAGPPCGPCYSGNVRYNFNQVNQLELLRHVRTVRSLAHRTPVRRARSLHPGHLRGVRNEACRCLRERGHSGTLHVPSPNTA